MARASFMLATYAPVEPAFALAFLSDLSNHHDLHPFLVRADIVATYHNAQGQQVRQYRIIERPRLGPLRYTISFRADLTIVDESSYASEVWAALGTRLRNRMECAAEGAGTRIRETVEVEAPRLTLSYVRRQAHAAHARTLRLLPEVLEKKFREGIALPATRPA